MKKILSTAVKILGWLVLLVAFASLGFSTDDPATMVPIYFIFFLLVFAGVFFFNMKRNNKKEAVSKKPILLLKILGILLLLISILTPSFMFRSVGFTLYIHIMIIILSFVLIALSLISIKLINRRKLPFSFIGYLLLIIISSVPALLMMQYDKSYYALGTAYYIAIIMTILAWNGCSLFLKNIKST